jgi:hypothetical protein
MRLPSEELQHFEIVLGLLRGAGHSVCSLAAEPWIHGNDEGDSEGTAVTK